MAEGWFGMSHLRMQSLSLDTFEERALPSVSYLALPSGYQVTGLVHVLNRSSVLARSFLNDTNPAIALVPMWFGRNGSATYMVVNLVPNTESQAITKGPISQRESATATREPVDDTPTTRSTNTPHTTSDTRTNLVAYSPERSATVNQRPQAAHERESSVAEPSQPMAPSNGVNGIQATAVLRDYSVRGQVDMIVGVGPAPTTPTTPDATEPTPNLPLEADPTLRIEDLNPLMPLSGLLPFNVADLEQTAQTLLSGVANLGADIADELTDSSEYLWWSAAALATGGAIVASRSNNMPTRSRWWVRAEPTDDPFRS